jgi:NAD(P)-dependent dehydrogenase (short-subunit alcohol dehydrogenase family)
MTHTSSVAVVTGAGRGIGRAVAERLAGSGHTVVAIARSVDELDAVAGACGAIPLRLDVSDPSAVADAWDWIGTHVGTPSLLVNNAGIAGATGSTWTHEPGDWWKVFEVNVFGTFLMSRAALPSMIAVRRGRIVNVASNAAFYPIDADDDVAINTAYMASKAAIVRFTEALAGEIAGSGLQAFVLSPGMVKTDMTAGVFDDYWDAPDLWSPPELTAELIECIDSGELDAMSGRYIHAARDDWRTMGDRTEQLLADDLHTLRVRSN